MNKPNCPYRNGRSEAIRNVLKTIAKYSQRDRNRFRSTPKSIVNVCEEECTWIYS